MSDLFRLLFHCSKTEAIVIVGMVVVLVVAWWVGNSAGHSLVSALPR